MDLSDRIDAFARLGDYLKENLRDAAEDLISPDITGEQLFRDPALRRVSREAREENPWFIPVFLHQALQETARVLTRECLGEWTGRYPGTASLPRDPRVVGTILAGNIPLVGFQDFLAILLSGHRFKGKMSGKDDKILPFLADKLISIESRFAPFIRFEDSRLGPIDAMIATGSNNTFRYFEYYFGKYPHVFRHNRNGIAVLRGNESPRELAALADDVFLYFGMGCRNVAKIYVPGDFDFDRLFGAMEKYAPLSGHHKYGNNYQYHRSVFLMNRVDHLDNGLILLCASPSVSSPVATLHYETWREEEELLRSIRQNREAIQCIVAGEVGDLPTVPFGKTQHPEPWDYADDVDTLNFLINLS